MLVFEKSRQGRGNGMLPKWEGETFELPKTEKASPAGDCGG